MKRRRKKKVQGRRRRRRGKRKRNFDDLFNDYILHLNVLFELSESRRKSIKLVVLSAVKIRLRLKFFSDIDDYD